MAVYTQELAADIGKPHIIVDRKLKDGVHYAWRLATEDGYVMYDRTANDTEVDQETMEERPVTYYYTGADCPLNFPMGDNFPYVAIPRSEVDENYIY